MTNFAVDVSSYQDSSIDYFKQFKAAGVQTAIIKLTQGSPAGDNYLNPKASEQIKSVQSVGMNVSVYHYFKGQGYNDSQNEAKFFLSKIQTFGLPKSTTLICDVEDPSLHASSVMNDVNAFMQYLINAGYTNVGLYSMASWFNGGILNAWTYPLWVASYGSSTCGVNGNVQAWQYTDNWSDQSVDMSYDYGLFNRKKVAEQPLKSHENVVVTKTQTYTRERFGMWLNQKIEPKTQWKSGGIIGIDGQPAYLVAGGTYLMQNATDQDGIATVHSYLSSKAPLINKKGNYVRTVINGDVYKFSNFVKINDSWCYQVAANEYLPALYTVGGGK